MAKWALAPFLFGLVAGGLGFTGLAGSASGYLELFCLFVGALGAMMLILGLAFGAEGGPPLFRPKAVGIGWPNSLRSWSRGHGGGAIHAGL